MTFEVLLLDDGSSQLLPPDFAQHPFNKLSSIEVLHIRRNVGHQRAIAIGLVYVHEHRPCRAVIVMDGDGEDRPTDIIPLLNEFDRTNARSIVFAARSKRLERLAFRILYRLYRIIHRILTGDPVRVGNFSVIPFEHLSKLVVIPEIWNHYAAAVIRSGVGSHSIPIPRGERLAGRSKMNFIGLLLHGLSAFFVYGEILGARLLIGITLALSLGLILIAAALIVHFTSSVDVSGLLIYAAGILGVLLLQAILVALVLVFTVIGSRVNISFLPIRDAPFFVSGVERVFPRPYV